jgi:uncharacterized protein (TIRG00374 family)
MVATANMTEPTPDPTSRQRVRDWLLFGALGVMVLGGLAALAASTGWGETWEALARIELAQIAGLLALSLVNYLLRGLRWHLFALRLGLPLGALRNLTHFLGGFLMTITPGRVGELVRMRWIRRETGWSFERTAPLVLVDRASDLLSMAILMCAAVALAAGPSAFALPVAALAVAAAVVVTRPALLSRVAGIGHRSSGKRLPRFFARLRRAARALSRFDAPGLMLAATGLGVVGWFAEGAALWLLLGWMGAELPLWSAVGIFVFATLAGGLTGAPGGLGGAEAAMVVLLVAQGVPATIAVPATLVIRVTTLWFAIGIGALVFPMAERGRKLPR